jgi:predicted ATPase
VFAVLANRCDRLTSTVMRHAVNQLAVSHAVDVDARHLKYLNPNINLSNIDVNELAISIKELSVSKMKFTIIATILATLALTS